LEAKIGRIRDPGQLRQVHETLSQPKKLRIVACTCQSSYCGKHKWEDESLGLLRGKKARFCNKKSQSKRAEGMTKVVEHLPSKCETLSSSLHHPKKSFLMR
jgi:hypothetical protein